VWHVVLARLLEVGKDTCPPHEQLCARSASVRGQLHLLHETTLLFCHDLERVDECRLLRERSPALLAYRELYGLSQKNVHNVSDGVCEMRSTGVAQLSKDPL
jgi:hypothetical protein